MSRGELYSDMLPVSSYFLLYHTGPYTRKPLLTILFQVSLHSYQPIVVHGGIIFLMAIAVTKLVKFGNVR